MGGLRPRRVLLAVPWGTVTGMAGVDPGQGAGAAAGLRGVPGRRAAATDGEFVNGDIARRAERQRAATTSARACRPRRRANPDFSQVESDAAQIDVNTTFALSYPEKRPFFQEGSDLFATWFNARLHALHQRPHLRRQADRPARRRQPSPSWSRATRTRRSSCRSRSAAPSSPAAAASPRSLRFQHSLGDGSHVGLIATDRRHDGGGAGTARRRRRAPAPRPQLADRGAGPRDPHHGARTTPSLTAGINDVTFDRGAHTAAFDGETYWGHARLRAASERSARHWTCDFDYSARSPTFRAENGFEPQNDRHAVTGWTAYTWYDDGLVERWQPQLFAGRVWNFAGTKKDEWLGSHAVRAPRRRPDRAERRGPGQQRALPGHPVRRHPAR